MAGSSRYTAILDANVLYPNLLRDILLSLAASGLYHARWSAEINSEWTRNLGLNRPDIESKILFAPPHCQDLIDANRIR
jgi:hypothetical protein